VLYDDCDGILFQRDRFQLIQSVVEETLTDGGFEIDIAASAAPLRDVVGRGPMMQSLPTILVVEDDHIELLDKASGKYRALVTDINLGRGQIDGWEIARHAREIDPEFPVVYMSGDSAEAWASKGVPNSIMLAKPFAPAQLGTAVSQLLNSGTPTA
jgi:CheY-like chemotaxis protein